MGPRSVSTVSDWAAGIANVPASEGGDDPTEVGGALRRHALERTAGTNTATRAHAQICRPKPRRTPHPTTFPSLCSRELPRSDPGLGALASRKVRGATIFDGRGTNRWLPGTSRS